MRYIGPKFTREADRTWISEAASAESYLIRMHRWRGVEIYTVFEFWIDDEGNGSETVVGKARSLEAAIGIARSHLWERLKKFFEADEKIEATSAAPPAPDISA